MFTIGEFAALGRLSVRMLRHYDAIGLLRPARVDPASGYRFYTADQLSRLNRVFALKDLGFTLQQVQTILDDKVDTAELRGMLRLRRAELEERVTADRARLARVEARLRLIESEPLMSTEEVVLKDVPATRVAQLSATAPGYGPENIGPVLGPLFQEVTARLTRAGTRMTGPAIAYYEPDPAAPESESIVMHAAIPVAVDEVGVGPDWTVVDLPSIPRAATILHRGSVDEIDSSYQVLARWVEENGYRGHGMAREVYLEVPEDRDAWVTELQLPIA